jgi:hypothetical protein
MQYFTRISTKLTLIDLINQIHIINKKIKNGGNMVLSFKKRKEKKKELLKKNIQKDIDFLLPMLDGAEKLIGRNDPGLAQVSTCLGPVKITEVPMHIKNLKYVLQEL